MANHIHLYVLTWFNIAEHYQIKRTCTDDFEVNFFMVNHACMTEGHRYVRRPSYAYTTEGHLSVGPSDACMNEGHRHSMSVGPATSA